MGALLSTTKIPLEKPYLMYQAMKILDVFSMNRLVVFLIVFQNVQRNVKRTVAYNVVRTKGLQMKYVI
jgi:hypothetical protein